MIDPAVSLGHDLTGEVQAFEQAMGQAGVELVAHDEQVHSTLVEHLHQLIEDACRHRIEQAILPHVREGADHAQAALDDAGAGRRGEQPPESRRPVSRCWTRSRGWTRWPGRWGPRWTRSTRPPPSCTNPDRRRPMDLETAAHDLLLKVRSLREKVGK